MKVDSLGVPKFSHKDLVNMIYQGHIDECTQVLCDETVDIDAFNKLAQSNGLPTLSKYQKLDVNQQEFDSTLQSEWFMPEEYKNLDLWNYFESIVPKSFPEYARVKLELEEYERRNLFQLLRFLIFLVALMRKENIVWGVGRGSSVASYILYLIGIQLSENELLKNIDSLSKKYWQTNNPDVRMQISVTLDMFKEELKTKMRQKDQKQDDNGNKDLDNLIKIN